MTTDERIRAAFREVALGLMAWEDPPLMSPREYRRLEGLHAQAAKRSRKYVWRPWCAQDDVEPFNVNADWEERS